MNTTMGPSARARAAVRAAHLYYLQDWTMDAIATDLGTSRSSVSRLLSYAREVGLVDIRVRSLAEVTARDEDQLGRRFGVTARVVSMPSSVTGADRQETVAAYAARFLSTVFDSNMALGVAWGSTMGAISRHIVPKETHNSDIVQLNGAGNPHTTGIDYASEILRRFSEAYSARLQQFPVPAFFDSAATREALWRERSTKRVLEMQSHLDIALFGIGSPFANIPSHVYIGGYLDEADYRLLEKQGVIGDVATVFFRPDGSSDNIDLNRRATGPDFDTLRRVPRRICVIADASKLPALHGALRAGLITDLIVDDGSAKELLERPDEFPATVRE